jgi:transposase
MDRQTLRDWALRFNADGPDGLLNRKGAGRPRLLTPDQMQALAELVETGPDRAVHGVVRWRRIDLQRVLEERFDVNVSLPSLSRLLDELAFSHISGRPQHPKQDPAVIAAFKKTSRARLKRT